MTKIYQYITVFKDMEEGLKKDFQQRPGWIFATLFILLIQASSAFNGLILDFFPELNSYWQGRLKVFFIIGVSFLFGWIYWWSMIQKKQKDPDSNKRSEKESLEKAGERYKWLIWRQNIFKHYPLNILKLKIIPLSICWLIIKFMDKKPESYIFDVFDFPKYWKNYDYAKVTGEFFKSMFRIYISQSYEVKFARDYQHIEIRWTEKDNNSFNEEPKKGLYTQIFSEDRFKHVKIFTWIFPFGLFWNLIRIIKSLFLSRNYYAN